MLSFTLYISFLSTLFSWIASMHPIHSILAFILLLFQSAFLFICLGQHFLAILLILIYVGAIAVLFLFLIIILNLKKLKEHSWTAFPFTALFSSLLILFPYQHIPSLPSHLSWNFLLLQHSSLFNIAKEIYTVLPSSLLLITFLLFIPLIAILTLSLQHSLAKKSQLDWIQFNSQHF